mmetsp:Transcript_137675/g.294256  ORF Transcript_137675/g.294256 Transcript_137675/m.294256 type:complete len:352 (+) Transcript_137675:18-1073(+)
MRLIKLATPCRESSSALATPCRAASLSLSDLALRRATQQFLHGCRAAARGVAVRRGEACRSSGKEHRVCLVFALPDRWGALGTHGRSSRGRTSTATTVDAYGGEHTSDTQSEDLVRYKVEEGGGDATRGYNGESRGEALRDVVCVLDNHRHDYPAEGLQAYDKPHHRRIADKKPFLQDDTTIVDHNASTADGNGEKGELHVADPEVGRAGLEHLLGVDASETTSDASHRDRYEAQHGVHLCHSRRILCPPVLPFKGGDLHHCNAQCADNDAKPLPAGEPPPEHRDTEYCSRHQLHLVEDLVDRGVQVACSNILQVVLQSVEPRRHKHQHRVEVQHLVHDLAWCQHEHRQEA